MFMGSVAATGLTALAPLLGAALLAMLVGRFLPEHHRNSETKSVVSVSMAVLGTMSALALGLLISDANSAYVTQSQEVTETSADMIRLDRLMRRYGPETQEARELLRRYAAAKLQDLFPADPSTVAVGDEATAAMLEALQDRLLALAPADEARRWLRAQALQLTSTMWQRRWLLAQQGASTIPFAFMALVVFWMSVVFASYGLFAPQNMTAVAALVSCAVGVSGAVMMILDLQTPFGGMIELSSLPMRHALEVISR
jgi:hypothetical protein